ncbi:enoyl-CoA hydratase-related protein [Actinophytocola gossypii]|uniref:Enoyl-CoA hydratase/isomerase family protein n=1 Tax=Actinophytocola gossypii TaxID=2812003 RepID=A0ABT2J309_9PSEU|nr:enoyl-CoA hydratase-related protein [Actinophytocola gossypii]MCT2582240.1 enoyl-CoA hydratase/isomerase family protein [Actinophytocola gossypii]
MVVPAPQPAPTVLYTVEAGIATLTLNRPDRLNAFADGMLSTYLSCLRRADADPQVRVVVVTGAGRGFCAGADFTRLESLDIEEFRRRVAEEPRDVAFHLGKPVIAAVNGPVAGIGLAHALMADVRFTVPDAKWTTAFARIGLVAECGIGWLLTNLVGTGRALDLLLSARRISGRQAHEYGLAQFLSEPASLMSDVRAYAATLADNDPDSLREIRQQVRLDASRPFPEALADGYERVFASLERGRFRDARARVRGA